MKISKSDIIFEHQTDSNFVPSDAKAYFGGVKSKDGIKSQISSYIDGYREAVNAIFDRFKTEASQGHTWVQDTIVFPLIFTHRHCVELELKRFFCLTDKKFDELSNNKTHRLLDLWSNVKDFLIERASRLNIKIDIEAINHYIELIDQYDEGSFRFRYPMSTSLESSNKKLEILTVDTFHRQMNLFHEDMDKIFHSLDSQVDEWKLDKDFKRQFPYCIKKNYSEVENALCYKYPDIELPNKKWLSASEIPRISEAEMEREYKHCQTVSRDVKEVLLILYYALQSINLNNIASAKSEERLLDILKVCNDVYSNENIFGSNIDNSFWKLFDMVKHRDEIISLAMEIVSLH